MPVQLFQPRNQRDDLLLSFIELAPFMPRSNIDRAGGRFATRFSRSYSSGVARQENPATCTSSRAVKSYRIDSDMPSVAALAVTAPGVRLRDFAIFKRPAFCFAIVLSVLRSSFDHNTRLLVFFGIFAPLSEARLLRIDVSHVKER